MTTPSSAGIKARTAKRSLSILAYTHTRFSNTPTPLLHTNTVTVSLETNSEQTILTFPVFSTFNTLLFTHNDSKPKTFNTGQAKATGFRSFKMFVRIDRF